MSVIEDVRKVLQDFLAPELRELKARFDASEKRADERHAETTKRVDDVLKRVDERHAEMTQRVDERHAEMTKRVDERHAETMEAFRAMGARIDRRVDSIVDFTELREKVAVLDAERRIREKVAS